MKLTRTCSIQPRQRRLGFERFEDRCFAAADATALVYDLNRLRTGQVKSAGDLSRPSSSAAAQISGHWAAPLAMNNSLRNAAEEHAQAMALGNFFSHQDPLTRSQPNQRVRSAGYPLPSSLSDDENSVEVIVAGSSLRESSSTLMELLSESASNAARREALLGQAAPFDGHTEIGVGFRQHGESDLGNYWVIEMARQHLGDRFVTGVVYRDLNRNQRYDSGEGLPGWIITNGLQTTTSSEYGAYSISVASGIHVMQLQNELRGIATSTFVRIDSENLQLDFLIDSIGVEPSGTVPLESQVNFRSRSIWTNTKYHLDANNSGSIEPIDALVVINRLNREGNVILVEPTMPADDLYLDTNGDHRISPLDALLVVNQLNRSSFSGAGEGEAGMDQDELTRKRRFIAH